jgi:hypothetical protein
MAKYVADLPTIKSSRHAASTTPSPAASTTPSLAAATVLKSCRVLQLCVEQSFYDVMVAPVGTVAEKHEEYRCDASGRWRQLLCRKNNEFDLKVFDCVMVFGGVAVPQLAAHWFVARYVTHCLIEMHGEVGPFSNFAQKSFSGKVWKITLGEITRIHTQSGHGVNTRSSTSTAPAFTASADDGVVPVLPGVQEPEGGHTDQALDKARKQNASMKRNNTKLQRAGKG